MKFMTIMSWKPENSQKVTEKFLSWKVPDDMKFLYGPCTIIGYNKSMVIFETTDEAWAKVGRYWRDLCEMKTYPLMDSAQIAKIKP